jgi:hypothetical protein
MLVYLLASALQQLALFPFSPASPQYAYGWLSSEIVLTILRVLVAAECFRLMTSLFPRLGSAGITVLYCLAGIAVAAALALTPGRDSGLGWEKYILQCVFVSRQIVLVVASVFLLGAILISRVLRLRSAPNVRVHVMLSAAYFVTLALLQMVTYRADRSLIIPVSAAHVAIPTTFFAWWMLTLRANGQTMEESIPNSELVFGGDREN